MRNLKNNCEAAYRFYEGDQWHGLDVEHPESTVSQNFIAPTITHKLANVCMNEMAVVFEGEDSEVCTLITETVNDIMKKIQINSHKFFLAGKNSLSLQSPQFVRSCFC